MDEEMINKIILGDAFEILPKIEDSSIDLVLTDPPYFLDKMDNKWKHKTVSTITNYCHVVKSLPPGMKFDKEQGKRFYEWYFKISKELYRVLKPGGFFFSFSSPRLYHRMVSAIDDAGFLIRDCFIWLYTQNQPKAMSLNHFIDKLDCDEKSKIKLKERLDGWKTPQIKSCFEPVVMAQKECEKTFLNNMLKYNVGLLNTNVKIGEDMFPSNVITTQEMYEIIDKCFLLPKPTKEEKGEFNIHKTVKPLAICEYIINLTTFSEDAIVLDPFVGSGTTAVAAKKLGRKFIGIDTNPEYVEITLKRLKKIEKDKVKIYESKKVGMQLRLLEPKSKYLRNKKRSNKR
ncbi:MAG: site-specific DNA-methyltransferase [Armatimonadetes bacterium CG07_land_8_20_14_0_80_40_9]|nr:MAG: site-specific DNA-methyltransferase [Armatimonadetes bacterium CG07_land_8_20_14_0_80_40_9]